MDSAPKDGSEILLCSEAISDMAVCYWSEELNGWTWGLGKKFLNPSHWMPLPESPSRALNRLQAASTPVSEEVDDVEFREATVNAFANGWGYGEHPAEKAAIVYKALRSAGYRVVRVAVSPIGMSAQSAD